MATKNKQDYASIKGYKFYLSNKLTHNNLNGAWNKVALILKLLRIKSLEWIVWMDYDSLIMDFDFNIPFEKYEGKDLILWFLVCLTLRGQEKELFEIGDAHNGLNTGVMLIRNTLWSRQFFEQVSLLGTNNGKQHEEVSVGINFR